MKARTVIQVGILLSICLIALPTIPGTAAPAPDADRRPRETFEALKKKLPQAVTEPWGPDTKVRLVRRIATDEAKIVLVSEEHDDKGNRRPQEDDYLVIYLRYFDGVWTTTRFETNFIPNDPSGKRAAHAMMLAIDQIGEK